MRSALESTGSECLRTYGRADAVEEIPGLDVDTVIIAVPDSMIAPVAAALPPVDATVIHLSGATTLDPLRHHTHAGSLHPLASLPDPVTGAAALRDRCHFATASTSDRASATIGEIVGSLGGTSFEVPDEQRARYHATAAVAANHLLAVVAQVERMADAAGVPREAFNSLMYGALVNAEQHGVRMALTGPVARGDWDTVRGHLASIDAAERDLYRTLARAIADLAARPWPTDIS